MDDRLIMEIARPYLGHLGGVSTDWTPVAGRARLYPETLDLDDPWQFSNFRVTG